MGWTLILMPLAGIVGTIAAARAIRRSSTRRSWTICTAIADALVAVAYIPIWSLLLAPSTPSASDYPAGLDRAPGRQTDRPEHLSYRRYTADEMNRLLRDPDGRAHLLWRTPIRTLIQNWHGWR
jgi:hypothetical protein